MYLHKAAKPEPLDKRAVSSNNRAMRGDAQWSRASLGGK